MIYRNLEEIITAAMLTTKERLKYIAKKNKKKIKYNEKIKKRVKKWGVDLKGNKFRTRLKVIIYWLFNHGEGLIVHCSFCKSTKLTLLEKKENGDIYESKYQCRKCGAIAENKEIWWRK